MTAYDDALATGSTRLCRCYRVTRADGRVYAFTDHDDDLSFDGLTWKAGAALAASEAAATLGLAPDELDASGALSADTITEADLSAGLWDGAQVEILDVDWSAPGTRKLLGRFVMGELERQGIAFKAELRSASAGLERPAGRIHSHTCDCRRVGDARCGVDLAAKGLRRTCTVVAADATEIWVTGASGFPAGTFDRGVATWTAGGNAGFQADVRVARYDGTTLRLSLWHLPSAPVASGDKLSLDAGCDRTISTCRARFANVVNFRGFPHMPGDSALTEYGKQGAPGQDGGSRLA